MGRAIDGCRNLWEGLAPVILPLVDIVAHHLLDGADPALNLAVCLVVVLSGHPDFDVQAFHDLLEEARGEPGVLVHDNAEGAAMDVKDNLLEDVKGFRGGAVGGDRHQVGVGSKSIHDHKNAFKALGFGKGSSEIDSQRLVCFAWDREVHWIAARECGGLLVLLAIVT